MWSNGRVRNSPAPSSMPVADPRDRRAADARLVAQGLVPGRQALRMGHPLDPAPSRSRRIGALSTRRRGWSREGKNDPVRSSGMASSTSPAVVATVLGRLPVRLSVRAVALRADHSGGPEPRSGPRGPARGQAAEDARPARSGSARTSRIRTDTAHWFVVGIAGVPPGESWSRNRVPTIPTALHGPADPSTPRTPREFATTLEDTTPGRRGVSGAPLRRQLAHRHDPRAAGRLTLRGGRLPSHW